MKKLMTAALAVLALGSGTAQAAEGAAIPEQDWSFDGIFGTFERAQVQRGLQVYREVCAACHGLRLVAFRNLEAIGYDEESIKALASEYTFTDGPDDQGEMYEREGLPSDRFPSPFPNDKAAAAANNGAAPPDLSLIAKARKGGPDYTRALLMGYEEPPADREMPAGASYNIYFPGNQIAMPPPLFDDGVEFADGTPATVEQMATDVAAFLMWTAEPNLEERKAMGLKVLIFLLVFTGVLYAAKRKIWADLH
jgi:ubiquinol-cytochrome c reductase cytochrome c1 subunit